MSWVVARTRRCTQVVAKGSTTATAASDHTVKADIRGLAAGHRLLLPLLRRRHALPGGAHPHRAGGGRGRVRLRFGVVSCANWEARLLRLVPPSRGPRRPGRRGCTSATTSTSTSTGEYAARGTVVRPHAPANEIITLADYRTRHGAYKTDPDRRPCTPRTPVIAIWDDHEFADNAWSGGAVNHTEGAEGAWTDRKAAAKQAYFEWMPVRPATAGTTYRRLRFGKLADLPLLDLRSFRSQQAATAAARSTTRTVRSPAAPSSTG